MTVAAGTRFGRYEIRSLIRKGGMGEVYLAQDTQLRRPVAIKLLSSDVTHDTERLHRFEHESYAASSLNHPNILTIHEIGSQQGLHYIATEYIDGESLRDRLHHSKMHLREVLEVGIQTASALSAAHQAGIVHRDIKPENIMLRRDGYIKVLDFGLAKLTDTDVKDHEAEDAPTRVMVKTDPGVVMGTSFYMSPEQARAQEVDARTDIWSLGCVIYEMVSGRMPFEGPSTGDVIGLILHKEPLPLARYGPEIPAELDRIVTKALEKDREERYQVVKDLALDLKKLKHHMEFELELERTVPPDERSVASHVISTGGGSSVTAKASAAQSDSPPVVHTTSSAEYIVSQIRTHKKASIVIAAAFVLAVATAMFFYLKPASALTDKDTILLADFVNTTADPVFDGTLKQGLAVQLAQSPFLNVFPDTRVRQTLRLMGRSADDRVTKEVAREICQRQGLKAFLAGSITNLGTSYVIALEAVNGQSGEEIAREQVEAESKEQVLKALSQAASRLRQKLGESLSSIQKFDAPLELTTSSLEALKASSLAYEQSSKGRFLEAIPFYKRAVELDPNFAYAYAALAVQHANTNQPKLAAEYAEKAFALQDRVSELEKLRITYFYHSFVTGDLDKQIEALQTYKATYPRDYRAPNNLSDVYFRAGQFEKSAAEAREGVRINPNGVVGYINLGQAFIGLSRFPDAREVLEQALRQNLDSSIVHSQLYQVAFVNGDAAAMQQQLDWTRGKPDEYVGLDWQAQTSAFAGQLQRSQGFSRSAVELATRSGSKEVAAQYAIESALRGAVIGQCSQIKTATSQAAEFERNDLFRTRGALSLALCGDAGQAQTLVDQLTRELPNDTLITSLWVPLMRAAVQLNRNAPAEAIQLLELARRYEAAGEFWPQYLRGLAYLKLKSGNEAAAEFQKILDNRGHAPLSMLYPLANLGLARAAALTGDTGKSRKAYQDFLALWKDADSDLTLLQEAKQEYEKLK
ncbi:MAG TPA: protein kinase [Pyrinomonadaceae bacterium]|nr:protein kinase [Pyrinomonadaceae bacterium]